MSEKLPAQIEVEDNGPRGIVFRLPRRDLGGMRWVGVFATMLGLLVATGVAFTVVAMVRGVPLGWGRHIFGYLVFLALPTLGGTMPLWWGLSLLFGRTEFHLGDHYLRKQEFLGPLSWSKRVPVDQITTLTITSSFNVREPERLPEWLHHFDCVRCRTVAQKDTRLVWGYLPELLEPLAVALAERCDKLAASLPMPDGMPRKPVGVYSDYNGTLKVRLTPEELLEDDESDDISDCDDEAVDEVDELVEGARPAETAIEVETFADGVTIKVPPAGIWKGSSGLFVFSLAWNGAMFLFTGLCILAILGDNVKGDNSVWLAPLFLSIFWAVGVVVLCIAINMGLRKAAIAIADGALMVIQSGPFGVKRQEWSVDTIHDISVGPSGMKVNHIDVLELQIHSQNRPKYGMLAGRTNAELYWLAKVLSSALEAPHDEPDMEGSPGEAN